ncbi:glucose-1-phosphate adenylyltransferase family protein [Syntrophorhabdus aromaticivorans]|uniref:Glucose-1-phosphate adenylyltransferase n=1 Tax=Syntrophorhabdus aromaticivorans TaxID=328301 RepID=A0A971S166_9BACT|nr:glucose-1-phosphate adenylyltransferase family protein [Syntrophorhabdus aromaticivorans]NLW35194.1 glucose-1-phosphate adenylyltransferase [Syntrophorhabdus aromaticivorans]
MSDAVAILMAGGVGSRLNILVRHRAKPAVPFGGIYRIIDFTLSNIANSDITRVAVLTQYKPLSLMDHIGDGSSWDLSGRTRGVKILPPKTGEQDWDWYRGTADAVRQNLSFITSSEARYVLILSGDHVYSMDYRPMVAYHQERGARVTIGMITVPWEETHQFGTAIIDENHRIVGWEEKSPNAKSNLASMGIYVFDRHYLLELLTRHKEEDFGHHIIPQALKDGEVFAYPFSGYWRDAGTIQAYWDANMDLLNPESGLTPESWGIMTNITTGGMTYDRPPARIIGSGRAQNCRISPGCVIAGTAENSILSPGVVIEEKAVVRGSIIMHDTVIREGATIERCIIDKNVVVGENAAIGLGDSSEKNREFPSHLYSGLSVIGKQAVVPDKAAVGTNCIICPEVLAADFTRLEVPSGDTVRTAAEADALKAR